MTFTAGAAVCEDAGLHPEQTSWPAFCPLTTSLVSTLTFSALLHVCIACTCSLPGCRARQPRPSCTDVKL